MAKAKDLRDDRKKEQIAQVYRTRLGHLKRAQILVRDDKMAQAVEAYNKYLGILALYFDITEEKLSPHLFDKEKDLTEMLLISHAYWDLAKAFDRSPSMEKESLRCLDQFIKFSIGFKYQHVNAQIVRKFNNKKQAHNPKAFEAAYHKIQINSKKCYIATEVFGDSHPKTQILRAFKQSIAHHYMGLNFIDWYYFISPPLIRFSNTFFPFKIMLKIIFYPILTLFVLCYKNYVNYRSNHH